MTSPGSQSILNTHTPEAGVERKTNHSTFNLTAKQKSLLSTQPIFTRVSTKLLERRKKQQSQKKESQIEKDIYSSFSYYPRKGAANSASQERLIDRMIIKT